MTTGRLRAINEADAPPSIEEIEAEHPGTMGYTGGIWDYLEVGSLRIVATYGGVFMSQNGGTWKPQSQGISVHPRMRLPYTSFGQVQLAGGMDQEESALFRSADGGVTFRRVTGAPFDQPFTYIRMQSESVAYGSYEWSDQETGTRYGPRIYRSTNGGVSWSPLNSDDIAFTQTGFAGQFVKLIAGGNTAGRLVVVMRDTEDKYLFATSDDSGSTWSTETEINGCMAHDGDPFVDGDTMMVPAYDGVSVYGYCRTTDAGENWEFVNITTSPQFGPGALITDPVGNLLLISRMVPFESTDGGATFAMKECLMGITEPPGAIESGAFDASGGLWVIYFDRTGASLPNVWRSADGGCTWDLTSVSNSLDDDVEDNVLDIDPDLDLVENALRGAGTATSRQVRIIGVGRKGSTSTRIMWGDLPTNVRQVTATVGGRAIVLTFKAPTTKGPGTVRYRSQCTSPRQRTSTVTSTKLIHTHANLAVGKRYTCTIIAMNPIGNSFPAQISRTVS